MYQWQFLSKFKFNYLWKMCSYPQFSFWILITLAKICFPTYCIYKLHKNIVVLGGTQTRISQDAQNVCAVTKGGTVLKLQIIFLPWMLTRTDNNLPRWNFLLWILQQCPGFPLQMLKDLTKGKVDNTVIRFNYFVGYMHLGHEIDNILNACCFTVLLDVSPEPVTVVWVEFALNTCDLEHLSLWLVYYKFTQKTTGTVCYGCVRY